MKAKLSPAKKKFAEVYAKTDNASKAVRIAYKGNDYTPGTVRNKGARLLADANINAEIENQKRKMELISSRSVERISQLIDSENEGIATANAWKAYEQVHGKAVTKNVSLTATTSIEDYLAAL